MAYDVELINEQDIKVVFKLFDDKYTVPPLDYQYNIVLPSTFDTNYYLSYLPPSTNNNIYSFFTIFNRNYILVKRNGVIIGAVVIKSVLDTSPVTLTVYPFRHISTNKVIETYGDQLYLYYGFSGSQLEPINYATITNIKLNIFNKLELRNINLKDPTDMILNYNLFFIFDNFFLFKHAFAFKSLLKN